MDKRYFAGIGSRDCPQDVLDDMFKISAWLCSFSNQYILRSGGANGCDDFAEKGCDSVGGAKEIFLPWKNFNNNKSVLFNTPIGATLIAKSIHPAWNNLTTGAINLHSRNICQILGQDLNAPVEFVLCYTENGEVKGGTATAINLSKQLNIPIFNLGSNGKAELKEYFKLNRRGNDE